jgi:hypothetical protein
MYASLSNLISDAGGVAARVAVVSQIGSRYAIARVGGRVETVEQAM